MSIPFFFVAIFFVVLHMFLLIINFLRSFCLVSDKLRLSLCTLSLLSVLAYTYYVVTRVVCVCARTIVHNNTMCAVCMCFCSTQEMKWIIKIPTNNFFFLNGGQKLFTLHSDISRILFIQIATSQLIFHLFLFLWYKKNQTHCVYKQFSYSTNERCPFVDLTHQLCNPYVVYNLFTTQTNACFEFIRVDLIITQSHW